MDNERFVGGTQAQPQKLATTLGRHDVLANEPGDEIGFPLEMAADRTRMRDGNGDDSSADDMTFQTPADDLHLG